MYPLQLLLYNSAKKHPLLLQLARSLFQKRGAKWWASDESGAVGRSMRIGENSMKIDLNFRIFSHALSLSFSFSRSLSLTSIVQLISIWRAGVFLLWRRPQFHSLAFFSVKLSQPLPAIRRGRPISLSLSFFPSDDVHRRWQKTEIAVEAAAEGALKKPPKLRMNFIIIAAAVIITTLRHYWQN